MPRGVGLLAGKEAERRALVTGSRIIARVTSSRVGLKCSQMGGVPKQGVPYWGPYHEEIRLFGGLYLGPLIFVNPPNLLKPFRAKDTGPALLLQPLGSRASAAQRKQELMDLTLN